MSIVTADMSTSVDTFIKFLKEKASKLSGTPKIALIAGALEGPTKRINLIMDTLKKIGFEFTFKAFDNNAVEEVIEYIKEQNADDSIFGIYIEEYSFGKNRQKIADLIHSYKDVGADSSFNKSMYFAEGVGLSPKLWAIKTILELNGYHLLSPYTCGVVGVEKECQRIAHYFGSLGATTTVLRPYTIDLQELSEKMQILVINDTSLIPNNRYNKDAVIINTYDAEDKFSIPTVGGMYFNYETYFSLYCIGVAWQLFISYITITKEEINENDD